MLLSDTHKVTNIVNGSLSIEEAIKFKGVSTDTRKTIAGRLFIALEGENFDGHLFTQKAEECGAKAIIAHKKVNTSLPIIIVKDTEKAYQKLATWYRQSLSPQVIAITGSNGKTTTKNMLDSILSLHAPTLSTRGNFNNHLGVPKTILELTEKHRYCVIEMGANHEKEITLLCGIAKPDLALITNANNAHLGEFGSLESLVKTKGEIFKSLSQNGNALMNQESPHKSVWQQMSGTRKFTFFGNMSSIYASNIRHERSNLIFDLHCKSSSINIKLAMIGLHQIDNALAAAACANELGVNLSLIKEGLEKTKTEKGRLQLLESNHFTILDDSYNANPHSMKAAIDTLQSFSGEKIAVLGSMAELGTNSIELHQEIGDYAGQARLDKLYTIGEDSKHYNGELFSDIESIYNQLKKYHLGATILIKGSRMMKLDELVNILSKTSISS
jgi:UDP-N-acetylmuramoyl-tripeptide--D-alanyl-D-alanine ligase